MYALLWRALPGPRWLKAIEALVLVALVVLLLFTVVFPWLQPRLPFSDVTVNAAPAGIDTGAPWLDASGPGLSRASAGPWSDEG